MHKIEERRAELGFSYGDIAVLSGVAETTIRRIAKADTSQKVNYGTAEALAYGLDANLWDLFRDSELSDKGRIGGMGGTTFVKSKHPTNAICPQCHLAIPVAHTTCQDCVA